MAEDRNPGLDNQERPEHEPMEQGYETPQNTRRSDLPDQEADDEDGQHPSDEDER